MKSSTAFIPDIPRPANFQGFSKKTVLFLHGLKKNNNKAWFESHRDDYEEHLRVPMKNLVEKMAEVFREKKLPFVANAKTSLFRINRDIRFSKDKSPYKTHIGISFPLEGTPKDEWSGLYFGFEPAGPAKLQGFIGGGVYMPVPTQLKKVRAHIQSDLAEFERTLKKKDFVREFPKGISGSTLTRMPKGYDETDPAARYLKMKEFLAGSDLLQEDIISPKLVSLLTRKFSALSPLAVFLGSS